MNTHWQVYWRKKDHISKQLCSNFIQIDAFKVCKEGKTNGFTLKPLNIIAIQNQNYLEIIYPKQKTSSYKIAISKVPSFYGKQKNYFLCPLCNERFRILYFAEKSIILCRNCLRLTYKSKTLRPTRRYDYLRNKIKEKLQNKGGSLEKKPHRMRNKTFQKLKNLATYYEQKSNKASNDELRQWYGPRIEPLLDGWFDFVDEELKSN